MFSSHQLYDPQKGVMLRHSGLSFVRAIAVAPGTLNSQVMTSRRYWVLTGEGEDESSAHEEVEEDENSKVRVAYC